MLKRLVKLLCESQKISNSIAWLLNFPEQPNSSCTSGRRKPNTNSFIVRNLKHTRLFHPIQKYTQRILYTSISTTNIVINNTATLSKEVGTLCWAPKPETPFAYLTWKCFEHEGVKGWQGPPLFTWEALMPFYVSSGLLRGARVC